MIARFFYTGFLFLLLPVVQAQVLSTSINPHDWGLTDPSRIRIAQLSVVHSARKPTLTLQALYESGFFADSTPGNRHQGCEEIANFDHESVNDLGGSYAAFQSGSSTASIRSVLDPGGAQTARLTYSLSPGGYCGLWMHLFNSAAPPDERTYFDATQYSYLHMRIRGHSGNERLLLKVADEAWNTKQDALPVAELGTFLPGGRVDTVWQTVVVPVKAFPGRLDRTRLATVVLEAAEGNGTVEISSIEFCETSAPVAPPSSPRTEKSFSKAERALWVWNTRNLLNNDVETAALRTFIADHGIDHIFLALPYDGNHPDSGRGVTIADKPMKALVQQLNASGAKVHSLVGDKDFIRPDKRSFVRTTVENIIRYQRNAAPAEQFYGIHLDIEPYLLQGFSSKRQPWFVGNFLDVLADCASLAREARLVIGADIPAWLDAPNELTHVSMELTRNGSTRPVYRHIIDLLDFVVLMDYRTGAGEIVTQSMAELRYAEQTGKRVFVGIETLPLPDETLFVINGEPKQGVPDRTDGKIMCFIPHDGNILAALIAQGQSSAFLQMLRGIGKTTADVLWWPVRRETVVPGSRLSFAGEGGRLKLETELREAEAYLRNFRSFGGFSMHDYEGYRRLISE